MLHVPRELHSQHSKHPENLELNQYDRQCLREIQVTTGEAYQNKILMVRSGWTTGTQTVEEEGLWEELWMTTGCLGKRLGISITRHRESLKDLSYMQSLLSHICVPFCIMIIV